MATAMGMRAASTDTLLLMRGRKRGAPQPTPAADAAAAGLPGVRGGLP
jgi:hypothetical protein